MAFADDERGASRAVADRGSDRPVSVLSAARLNDSPGSVGARGVSVAVSLVRPFAARFALVANHQRRIHAYRSPIYTVGVAVTSGCSRSGLRRGT